MSAALSRPAAIVTWSAYGILLIQQGVDAWFQGAPWIVWVVKLSPLLLFLPGMLKDNLRSFIWLCFVTLIYFMLLVLRLFANPGDTVSLLGMISVVTLFVASMMYVRWRAREIREEPVDE